jgi:hypothetical protein
MRSTSSLLLGGTGLSPSVVLTGGSDLRDPFPFPKRACVEPEPAVAATRTRLDELHPSLHCSIVGTCFGLRELRQLVIKFADPTLARAGDHTIHTEAVRWASRRDGLGRMVGKTLERKFKATIARFARATDVAALRQMWLDAMASGDIPGAYWAVLTHAAATSEFVREAFSDVHMLSHLVGAANRADIRRLQELEREKSALEDKLARQQRHLTETLGGKERQIKALLAALAERECATQPRAGEEDLAESLKRKRYRRMQLERRIATLEDRVAAAEQADRSAAPAEPVPAPAPCCEEHAVIMASPALACTTILLVGGRPAQVPPLTRAVERAGGVLLHHDGGREMSLSLLPGLVGRADRVAVALDCVSHAAASAARRLVRDTGKSLDQLPTLSLNALAGVVSKAAQEISRVNG